jgi:hypothetical protein
VIEASQMSLAEQRQAAKRAEYLALREAPPTLPE